MPRLLLVDDNESIHKIAETLLASTDIQLVCAKSAKEAIHIVGQGSLFDAALLDTAMAEMDGWALLEHFRQEPATMNLPIAMMAGVLDTVDPAKIAHSPIQGFLKKPVEFRDLSDRVHKLINTMPKPLTKAMPPRVSAPESLVQADMLDDIPTAVLMPPVASSAVVPADHGAPLGQQQSMPLPGEASRACALHDDVAAPDLLLLTAEDLLDHPTAAGTKTEDLSPFVGLSPAHGEESLELEDLDLDHLQSMPTSFDTPAGAVATHEMHVEEAPELSADVLDLSLESLPPLPTPSPAMDKVPDKAMPDILALPDAPGVPLLTPPVAMPSKPLLSETQVPLPPSFEEVIPHAPAAPMGSSDLQAKELVQAILADPALTRQLAKALIGNLSENTFREIAWEVMPDLVERLQTR